MAFLIPSSGQLVVFSSGFNNLLYGAQADPDGNIAFSINMGSLGGIRSFLSGGDLLEVTQNTISAPIAPIGLDE